MNRRKFRRNNPSKKRPSRTRKRKKRTTTLSSAPKSKKKENSKYLLTACALQQQLSKKYNFNQKKPKRIRKRSHLTLSQKLGLSKPPSPRLQKQEWETLKKKNLERGEECCSICLEEFDLRNQVILSCSHSFHATCLKSFENFAKQRICPICRKEQYQKTKFTEGKKRYIESTAILVQSIIRTNLIKKRFFQLTLESDPKKRMEYFLNQMSDLNERLSKRQKFETYKVDKMLEDVDKSMKKSRLLLFTSEDWINVKKKARDRDEKLCSICLEDLKKKKCCVTSCSHVFHVNCLQTFENYQNEPSNYSCPTCRDLYFRVEFEVS